MANPVSGGGGALIILDMLNRLDFDGGERLRPHAEAAAAAILALRDQADAAGAPVIYCNDNHGDWTDDRAALIAKAKADDPPGRKLAEMLEPSADDYVVVKPQFSGFYATTLPAILPRLGVDRFALTGVAADICVLFTAADAHMREYKLWVPADAVASEAPERARWALDIMEKSMGAETSPTTALKLTDWLAAPA